MSRIIVRSETFQTTLVWKNNDLKNVIAKMATISTVATNGASTLHITKQKLFSKLHVYV